MDIPVPYQLIMNKIHEKIPFEEVSVKEFRKIITITFRFDRTYISRMMVEMEKLGLIEYLSHQSIKINKI